MPSVTFWSRVEPFTRLEDIDAGVAARTHDPLWLLARQWQTGEFLGEDAGTPVQVRVRMDRLPMARYHAGPLPDGGEVAGVPYRADIPLETLVEGEPVQLAGDPRRDLRLAAEAGLMFLRMLERAGVSAGVRTSFVAEPSFALAAPGDDPAAGQDLDADGYLTLMSGRVPDGFEVYQAFSPGGGLPAKPVVPQAERPKVIVAGQAFVDWFRTRYDGPASTGTAWVPERMEYAFGVAVSTGFPEFPEFAFIASEYPGGTLDWSSFDPKFDVGMGVQPGDPQPESLTRTVIPAPVRYPGMAADRWWQFEDAGMNLSRIDGDPDELMRLLLLQFSLLYSNDWYVLPVDAAPGAGYNIRSLVVTDAFGERTRVKHYSESTPGSDWQMYSLGGLHLLMVPPVLVASQHGEPIEEVSFVRDEVANLVWAVEHSVPSLAGGTIDRQARHRLTDSPTADSPDGALSYRIASAIPPHWIPFQPNRIDPDLPDIRLRRAAALLDNTGGNPILARPFGRVLEPQRPDLTLFEEEIPSTGVTVTRRYQFARGPGGQSHLWLAHNKVPGRPAESSGLRYDAIDD